MSKKVVKHFDAESARVARMDAQELDKIHSDFVKGLPCHYWPRPKGFSDGENRESVIRVCLDDLCFLCRALECYEHWLLVEETKSIPLTQCSSHFQDSVVESLEHSFSIRKFFGDVQLPDIVFDEDLPF